MCGFAAVFFSYISVEWPWFIDWIGQRVLMIDMMR